MNKRWWRYGLVGVALIAVVFGLTHMAHRGTAAGDSHSAWVTAITNQVAASNLQNNPQAHGTASVESGPAHADKAGTQVTAATSTKGNAVSQTSSTTGAKAADSSGSAPKPAGGQSEQSTSGAKGSMPGAAPAPNLGTFTVVVTVEYPKKLAPIQTTVPIVQGETLMEYMHHMPYSVQTAYNDQFVTAINGVQSLWTGVPADQRKPVDWFLYVNGHEAPVGAGAIVPRAGDVELWDYHSWDTSTGRG